MPDRIALGQPLSSFPASSVAAAAGVPARGPEPGSDLAPAAPGRDRVEISAVAYRMHDQAVAEQSTTDASEVDRPPIAEEAPDDTAPADQAEASEQAEDLRGLTEEELRTVEQMAQRDREVRQHEMAHMAAAGRYARGGISLRFERGPDGRSYAVAGSVGIDTGPESDPQRTMAKMQQVRRAALAPAQPSSQDRMIAAQAAQRQRAARAEYMQAQAEELAARHEVDSITPPAITIAATSAAGPATGRLQQATVDFMA